MKSSERERATSAGPGAHRWAALLAALVLATVSSGCGPSRAAEAGSAEIRIPVEPRYVAGKEVAESSNCLACHKFAESGSSGPGPDLTTVGSRYDVEQLHKILDNPPSPMPSYRDMPASDKRALVEFLAQLKNE